MLKISRPSAPRPASAGHKFGAVYAWACERLYHEMAPAYDRVSWLVSAGQWNAWRELALAYVAGERVLELGFGTGALLAQLADLGYTTFGVDSSAEMQCIAAERLNRQPDRAHPVQAVGQALPFAAASFDTIVATFPAPYILDPATLSECARVLAPDEPSAPGGRLVIVGLWVELASPRLAALPALFYATPSSQFIAETQRRLQASGFAAAVHKESVSWANIGIVDAVRLPRMRARAERRP